MQSYSQGIDKDRLPTFRAGTFDCTICFLLAFNPCQCPSCGTTFCLSCYRDWLQNNGECLMGCPTTISKIIPLSEELMEVYNDIDVTCKNSDCGKVVKMKVLQAHEASCKPLNLPKCEYFELCGNKVSLEFGDQGICGLPCQFVKKIKESQGNWKLIYKDLVELKKNPPVPRIVDSRILEEQKNIQKDDSPLKISPSKNFIGGDSSSFIFGTIPEFRWKSSPIGSGIEIGNGNKSVFLNEKNFLFKSVIGDIHFMGGVHYWEIVAEKRTENELKIGVTTTDKFDFNSAFCDISTGFAYYGVGQVRNGSNSLGGAYGGKFKNHGVLGVCLNMDKGTLSFALNGAYWGVAFRDTRLTKGPIFPAVALLHTGGCTLRSGMKVPAYFE